MCLLWMFIESRTSFLLIFHGDATKKTFHKMASQKFSSNELFFFPLLYFPWAMLFWTYNFTIFIVDDTCNQFYHRLYIQKVSKEVVTGCLLGSFVISKNGVQFFPSSKVFFLSSKTCEFFIFYTKLIKKNNLCDVIKLIKLEIFFAFWFLAKTIKKLWVSNEHVLTAGILISDWSSRSSCSRYFIFSSRVWYKELRRVYERDENCFNIYKFLRSVHVHTFNKMKSEMTWERQR